MRRFSRRMAMGIGFSLSSMAMGGFESNEGRILFEELEAWIEAPHFVLSPTGHFYDAEGQTLDGRFYSFIVWRQSRSQVAAIYQIWGQSFDESIIVTDTADEQGDYGVVVDVYRATTSQLKQLKILPRGNSASSEAKYQSVSRSLKDPMSPVYSFDTTSIVVEMHKAVVVLGVY